MKGLSYVGVLFGFIYLCAALTPVAIQYSEHRCVRSLNPYDPLHDFLPCVKPGSSFLVTVTLNSSSALSNVKINQNDTLCMPNCISGLSDVDVGSFSADSPKTVNLTLSAPAIPGLHQPLIIISSEDVEINRFYLRIEVTCSNGIFCDGLERWSNGECIAGTDPCDDGFACTLDVCSEPSQLCSHISNSTECASCGDCDKTCAEAGTMCGQNDCDENCGDCNVFGDVCLPDIGCRNASVVMGTCSNPIALFPDGFDLGLASLTGMTTDGVSLLAPSCASQSTAPEKVYSLTVNGTYYADIRVYGDFDVVFSAFLINNCGPNIYQTCNDDSTPPGNLGSRISTKLVTGTYYFLVDGYSSQDFGEFTMEFRFSATCAPSCAGKFCGSDLCGGDCGPCGEGFACSSSRTCIPDPCVSACNVTRFCGIGQCGEDCGSCPSDKMCVQSTGECVPFPSCNHMVPICTPECGEGEFCGTDCNCYSLDFPLPDLVITEDYLGKTIGFTTETFSESHCAIVENCLSRPGTHRLLRFGVEALNQGKGPIAGKDPADNPQLYEWSPCHAHYHFQQFSEYFLLSADGKVVKEGRKQAYCLRDSRRVLKSPATSCKSRHDCSHQGINAGWSDIYGPTLDCQWLEVNDIEPGDYVLFISVNPGRIIHESNFENNGISFPLTITAANLGLNITSEPVSAPIAVETPEATPQPLIIPFPAVPRTVVTSLALKVQVGFGLLLLAFM